MAARDVLKNLNLFVNGKGYAGQIEEYNPPKFALKTEEFMGGGMNVAVEIEMAMEKMECDFSLISYDSAILASFGVAQGATTSLTVRGHLESFNGDSSGVVHYIRGKVKELDRGTWKPGEKAVLKSAMAVTYFKEVRDGLVMNEIDPENMVFIRNGVDLLSAARANLGI